MIITHFSAMSLSMKNTGNFTQAMRLPFLVLTPCCVFLAVAIAIKQQITYSLSYAFLCLIGALAAHIAVNTLNEYQDFTSGLDLQTKKTPFSGGSGLLPEQPHLVTAVFYTSVISLVTTIGIGSFFIYVLGWQILPIGLIGVLLIITYTKWINKHAFLCLIAPGLGFATLITGGTYFCISQQFTSDMWLISIIPFLLINNLLLLNQFPDLQADKQVGRNHFVIRFGIPTSIFVYALFAIISQLLLVWLVFSNTLPVASLATLAPMLLSYFSLVGMLKHQHNIGEYPRFLAANVASCILSCAVLTLTLIV